MSVAQNFAFLGVFRDCYPVTTVPTPGSNDVSERVYFGPFTLAQAMALYWKSETISVNGRTLTGYFGPGATGPVSPPKSRVCALDGGGVPTNIFDEVFSAPVEGYTIVFENQVLAVDGYYIPVSAFINSGSGFVFSLNPIADTGGSGLTKIATYGATIFGVSASIYLYQFGGGSPPGDPSFAMVANSYTFP